MSETREPVSNPDELPAPAGSGEGREDGVAASLFWGLYAALGCENDDPCEDVAFRRALAAIELMRSKLPPVAPPPPPDGEEEIVEAAVEVVAHDYMEQLNRDPEEVREAARRAARETLRLRAERDAADDKAALIAAEGERDEARADAERLRGALRELRIRYHASGRRPEECYEMSIIAAALAGPAGGGD